MRATVASATRGSRRYSRVRLHQVLPAVGRRIHNRMCRRHQVDRTVETRRYRRSPTPTDRPPAGVESSIPPFRLSHVPITLPPSTRKNTGSLPSAYSWTYREPSPVAPVDDCYGVVMTLRVRIPGCENDVRIGREPLVNPPAFEDCLAVPHQTVKRPYIFERAVAFVNDSHRESLFILPTKPCLSAPRSPGARRKLLGELSFRSCR